MGDDLRSGSTQNTQKGWVSLNRAYLEVPTGDGARLDPGDLVGACLGEGVGAVLLDEGALPAEFFDLSSGLAGEFVQKAANYRLQLAAVVPDPGVHSMAFQDFAREISRSSACRFFRSRAEAVAWLTSAG